MTSITKQTDAADDPLLELHERAEALEQKLVELQQQSDARLIYSELRAEAMRFGMVDLDGLKLLDLSAAKLNEKGEVEGAMSLMAQFKKTKPWLFAAVSSSSVMSAPPAQALRQKLATEMTDTEYQAARAALLKQRTQ